VDDRASRARVAPSGTLASRRWWTWAWGAAHAGFGACWGARQFTGAVLKNLKSSFFSSVTWEAVVNFRHPQIPPVGGGP
jgi:hypothetical protein